MSNVYRARVGSADRCASHPRWMGRNRRGPDRRRRVLPLSVRRTVSGQANSEAFSREPRNSRHPPRSRQRSHASRAVLDGRACAAIRLDGPLDPSPDGRSAVRNCRALQSSSGLRLLLSHRLAPPARWRSVTSAIHSWPSTYWRRQRCRQCCSMSSLASRLVRPKPGCGRTRVLTAVVALSVSPVNPGLAPHAPYSVSPDLFRAVSDAASSHGLPSSVHLGESPEEVEFLMTGRGGDRRDAQVTWARGTTRGQFRGCDPVEYLDSLGVFRPGSTRRCIARS